MDDIFRTISGMTRGGTTKKTINHADTVPGTYRMRILNALINREVDDAFEPTLVIVFAEWCGHCTNLLGSQDIENIRTRNIPMVLVNEADTDANPVLSSLGVASFPTLILVIPVGSRMPPLIIPVPRGEGEIAMIKKPVRRALKAATLRNKPAIQAFLQRIESSGPVMPHQLNDMMQEMLVSREIVEEQGSASDLLVGQEPPNHNGDTLPSDIRKDVLAAMVGEPHSNASRIAEVGPILTVTHAPWCGHCKRLLASRAMKEATTTKLPMIVLNSEDTDPDVQHAINEQRVSVYPTMHIVLPVHDKQTLVLPFPNDPESAKHASEMSRRVADDPHVTMAALSALSALHKLTHEGTSPIYDRDQMFSVMDELQHAYAAYSSPSAALEHENQDTDVSTESDDDDNPQLSPKVAIGDEVFVAFRPRNISAEQLCEIARTQLKYAKQGMTLRQGIVANIWKQPRQGEFLYEVSCPVTSATPAQSHISQCEHVFLPPR